MKLPAHVEQVREIFARLAHDNDWPDAELREVAQTLIEDQDDLVRMWHGLERMASTVDNLWVWGFLRACHSASTLPTYHYMSGKDRRLLISEINKAAKKLTRLLTANQLDGNIVLLDGAIFNGYYLFEDFGDSNQARINDDGLKKLPVSQMISRMAERAAEKITKEPLRGKKGKNDRAIRFVRMVADRNNRVYKQPLLNVIATACNALHGTNYYEADVHNLISR